MGISEQGFVGYFFEASSFAPQPSWIDLPLQS